ncbi:OmpA family protein [Arcobacter sp.]|uniref:OmpA family protein n=1 Tax=unclassified Arcobacter TaxID=2593671 RepID=UPI003B000C4D|eukprot:TRINITY_DN5576_c0_g1_i3.p1 TRINITY_DN5576_c0_g1~~TRINITY_DN5576_c0_g1_i3.p1  ORF type:complete len:562 (-),score=-68.64 TRINITY_DN5576_c0_g1_i3:316-2001(-)
MKKKIITLSLCASILLTGCSTTEFQNSVNKNLGKIGGTGVGAGAGAVIGKQIGGKKGVLIGAIIGGTIGYFIGSEIDERRTAIEKIAKEEKIPIYFEDVKAENGDKIGQAFITEDKYQFNTASNILNPKAKGYFTEIAKQYAKSGQKVLIIGHTDDRGSDSYNYNLSEKRAKTVAQIFKDAGVKGENIYFYGLGETKPIATNKTSTGQGKNRRVEIVEAPTEKDIARYAYMKPANGNMFNKEKIGQSNKGAIIKGKELAKNKPVIKNSSELANSNLPLSGMGTMKNVNINVKPIAGGKGNNKVGSSSIEIGTTNFKGNELYAIGNGVSDNKGQCRENDFLYYAKNKNERIVLSGGERFQQAKMEQSFEKVVGMPLKDTSFSLVTKAYAGTEEKFYSSCLEDSFKEKGTVKNFETGREVLIEKVVTQIPWLDGTQWYGDLGENIVSLSPISVSVNNVEPITCPNLNFIKKGNNNPTLSMSTKVVTRQGDRGFIYRIYPTIKNSNSNFECMDVAYSDEKNEVAHANVYYSLNGKYYKKDVDLTLLRANKNIEDKKEGFFSWMK